MAFFDLPLDQLRSYKPPRAEEADFDAFWSDGLSRAASIPLDAVFVPYECGLGTLQVYDVAFSGYGGERVKGWLIFPTAAVAPAPRNANSGRFPCMVEFVGYGGGRAFPWDWLLWAGAGYAHFVMDNRGQGASWLPGDTADSGDTGPSVPGVMTRGLDSPERYYYRRLMIDAVRAIEVIAGHPKIDAGSIAVTGGSQGGGVSIAAAFLSKHVRFLMPDVPFLCHYRRATELTDADPYGEISRYLHTRRDSETQTFRTLSYFDGINFAARIKIPALYSVALMDTICPPSTVFAAYNWHGGEKDIRVYPYNNHEGGGTFQVREKLAYAARMFST